VFLDLMRSLLWVANNKDAKQREKRRMNRLTKFFMLVVVLLAAACQKSPTVQFVNEETERATKYHDLIHKLKADQAEVKDLAEYWTKICKARKQVLLIDSGGGDPGCGDDKTAASQSAPAVPSPAAPMKGK